MRWWERWWENLMVLLRRKQGSSSPNKGREDDDDEDDGAESIEEKKEDKSPGNVKLNSGDYGKVFGINRKIVAGLLVTLFVVVFLAFLFNIQNRSERQKPQQETRQEEAASVNNASKEGGYDALFRENQKHAKNTPQQTDPMARKTEPAAPTPAPAQTQTPAPVIPTTPAYMLPASRAVQQAPAVDSKEKEERERERSLDERYRSAIAFALGKDSSALAGGAAASAGDSSNAAVQIGSSSMQYTAPSDSMLQAGTLIPAMLFTGINTDIAGQATAQVMVDVYDTATQTNLLIPAGSQLIGSYEAGNNSGNGRVNVTFSTLVLPDGGSYALGSSMVAVDGAGYNGISGKVHRHTGRIIRQGILNSAMTALSTIAVDRVTLDMSSLNNMTNTGIKDTVTVEPGREFNLYVTKPLSFTLP